MTGSAVVAVLTGYSAGKTHAVTTTDPTWRNHGTAPRKALCGRRVSVGRKLFATTPARHRCKTCAVPASRIETSLQRA